MGEIAPNNPPPTEWIASPSLTTTKVAVRRGVRPKNAVRPGIGRSTRPVVRQGGGVIEMKASLKKIKICKFKIRNLVLGIRKPLKKLHQSRKPAAQERKKLKWFAPRGSNQMGTNASKSQFFSSSFSSLADRKWVCLRVYPHLGNPNIPGIPKQ